MDSDGGKKKRYSLIGIAVVLVVGAAVGTVVGIRKHNRVQFDASKAGSMKLVIGNTVAKILCQHTDYKSICEDNLSCPGNQRDPKELVKVTFNAAVEHIQVAIEKSVTLKVSCKDPRASNALDSCKDLLDTSIDDLKRSFTRLDIFDITKLNEFAADLRVWLSGAVTYQETCLDAFENTTGDSGMKMKALLQLGGELTRNSLAMIDGIAELVKSLQQRGGGLGGGGGGGLGSGGLGGGSLGTGGLGGGIEVGVGMGVGGRVEVDQAINDGVTGNSVDLKVMAGNRRMLDQASNGGLVYAPDLEQQKPGGTPFDDPVRVHEPKARGLEESSPGSNGGLVYAPNLEQQKPGGTPFEDSVRVHDPKTRGLEESPITNGGMVYSPNLEQRKPGGTPFDDPIRGHDPKARGLGDSSEELKPDIGKGRILDYASINNDQAHVPDSKLMVSHEDHGSFPSWADGGRRSLINVDPKTIKPNAVVAQDGSGNFKTIQEAVNLAPKKGTEPFIIVIKAGTYNEYVVVPRHINNVVFLGEGPTTTKITGNKNYIDGVGTYQTATVAVNGDGFMAKDVWFENSAGPQKHQAVALRVSADMSIFHNCAMDGYQDTLYAHSYRQFFRQCTITGTIDFLFGDAAAVFQDCKLIVRKPMDNQACMVTAQGRKDYHSVGGIVLQGCTITAEPDFMNAVPMPKSYLGRPWKEFSRTVIMQTFIDRNIVPEGWSPWTGTFGQDTCYYTEFDNKGPAADQAQRPKWKGIKKISPQEAEMFTAGKFIQGDAWIPAAGVPYDPGMMKV